MKICVEVIQRFRTNLMVQFYGRKTVPADSETTIKAEGLAE